MKQEKASGYTRVCPNIYKSPNGFYRGEFVSGGERFVFYDKNLSALKRKLKEEKAKKTLNISSKESNITLNEYFDVWMDKYKSDLKLESKQTYKQVYDLHVRDAIGNKKLKNISTSELQDLFNGLTASESNKCFAILSGMFKKATTEKPKRINENPMLGLEGIKRTNYKHGHRSIKSLSKEQLKQFMKAAKEQGSEYLDFYTLASRTGMRVGEILALDWNHVDMIKECLTVRGTLIFPKLHSGQKGQRFIDTPKTAASVRTIDFSEFPEVAAMFKRRKQEENRNRALFDWQQKPGLENLIFVYPNNGSPWWDTCIRCDMEKIVNHIRETEPDFPHITPHSFRHTVISLGLAAGCNIKQLQSIAGHSTASTTLDIYADALPEDQAQEFRKLKNFLNY